MELAFVTANWPQLTRYVPGDASPVRLTTIIDGASIDGYCNNPSVPLDRWVGRHVASEAFPPFVADPDVPPAYFACGVHLRGNLSEYVFAMWERSGRRFWFYDRFFSAGNPGGHSVSGAADALAAALRSWEGGTGNVMYHGDRGWFNAHRNAWEWTAA